MNFVKKCHQFQLSDAQAALKTAESNISKDKLYLDRLLTIVVEQAPHLLSMMEEGSLERCVCVPVCGMCVPVCGVCVPMCAVCVCYVYAVSYPDPSTSQQWIDYITATLELVLA